jgi:hypothetical protein
MVDVLEDFGKPEALAPVPLAGWNHTYSERSQGYGVAPSSLQG